MDLKHLVILSKKMKLNDSIFVAGHNGMVGAAIVRHLKSCGYTNMTTKNRSELDLTSKDDVARFFQNTKIKYIFLAAAKVGGINANNVYPADFIYENLMIETNVIHEAFKAGIKHLLFLGSSCIYPGDAKQPIKEEYLLTGQLEKTNEPYAIAKIAGIKLCESYNRQHGTNYRSIMPTNLYGPYDNFHPENSHVVPSLIQKFHNAKINNNNSVEIWGTGNPRREFLYVDDMASASIFIMNLEDKIYEKNTQPMLSHINVGTGVDLAIRDLAELIKNITEFKGDIKFNSSMPDGTPRKLLDVTRLTSIGWSSKISLKEGIRRTYDWFLSNQEIYRK